MLSLPANTDIIFYDGVGIENKKYHTGIPPFLKFRKEKSNAIYGDMKYAHTDNRGHEINTSEKDMENRGHEINTSEKDMESRFEAIILQSKLLNKYAVKTDRNISMPNVPAGLGNRNTLNINKLEK